MAQILIAWEMGAGLGHLTRLLPVAEALAGRGHRLTLALQHLEAASATGIAQRLPSGQCAIRQAPRWPVPRWPGVSKVPTHSLADVLKLFRYHDPLLLAPLARAWRDLLRQEAPDLVIGDFCPTLRLSLEDRCPIVMVGNGYTIPPAGRPLPPIRPWEQILPPASVEAEADIMRTVAAEMAASGSGEVGHLSDLFSGARTFVCTVPYFDPYAAYRREPTVDPFNLPSIGDSVPLAERPADRVFLYMPGDHPDVAEVLGAIQRLDLTGAAYVPQLPASLRDRFAGTKIELCDKPQPLGELLPTVGVLIHHGGLSTAYAGLASGTPQLLATWNLEHLVTARGVARFGCARVTMQNQQRRPDTMVQALRELVTDQRPRQAAEAAARIVTQRKRENPLSSILAACDELLAA